MYINIKTRGEGIEREEKSERRSIAAVNDAARGLISLEHTALACAHVCVQRPYDGAGG